MAPRPKSKYPHGGVVGAVKSAERRNMPNWSKMTEVDAMHRRLGQLQIRARDKGHLLEVSALSHAIDPALGHVEMTLRKPESANPIGVWKIERRKGDKTTPSKTHEKLSSAVEVIEKRIDKL
jgi:hypothetical protein